MSDSETDSSCEVSGADFLMAFLSHGVAHACGELNTTEEFVEAMVCIVVQHILLATLKQFDGNPNPNNAPSICGMCVKITGPKGNVKVKVIGDRFQGRIPISWNKLFYR
ncbi:unnamed protein product [Rhizophagus irregularis]|nr:unnamed protein product [Rhizophagus irregularis]